MAKTRGILKNITGSLKLAVLAIPFVIAGGSIAADITMVVKGSQQFNSAINDAANSSFIQELREEEQKILDLPLEESGLSPSEHAQRSGYLKSEAFIRNAIKNYDELKEYKERYNHGQTLGLSSIALVIPFSVGLAGIFRELDSGKKLVDSAKNDFEEAKKYKSKTKEEKELQSYDEEIIH